MLKKGLSKIMGFKKTVSMAAMAIMLMMFAAVPAFASGPSTLADATAMLTDGADEIKTNAFVIIGVVITILVIVFGISWLITMFKKKMSKAS